MSTTTWMQYVAMEDAACEPRTLEATLASLEDWEDDFEIGEACFGEPTSDLDDPE